MASITVWIATAFLCTGDGCVQIPDHTSRRFDSKTQCEDVMLRAIDKMWERHQLAVQAVCTPYFLSSTETPGFYSPPPPATDWSEPHVGRLGSRRQSTIL